MKNFKKLSRQELKTVTGAADIGGTPQIYCGKNRKWCENTKTCVDVSVNCNDFIPYPGNETVS
ncbi:hypothetical protein ABXT08_05025 [Chryseobacterium sp. NRRL B-14859]|uniref:bacteriocin-like protein n=1 Tax=Chryseobacterium sp. NRRL B-14859 TaxID=1562763 RepID=UPI0033909DA6